MDGVRRWIGANHQIAMRQVSDKTKKEIHQDPKIDAEDLDPTSMEAIISRLLSPVVSDVEEAEYEW